MRRNPSTTTTRTTRDRAASRTDRLETPRLVGEPVSARHHDELRRLLGDPRVGETLGGVKTPAQVRDGIALLEDHWQRDGFGYSVWRMRETGAFVGRGGLRRTEVDGALETEVGAVAFTLPDNVASRRVMEKLGFEYEKEIVYAGLAHVLHRLRSARA